MFKSFRKDIAVLLSVFSLSGCSFFVTPSIDTLKENLTKEEYEVIVTDNFNIEDTKSPVYTVLFVLDYLYASKGEDFLHVMYFIDVETCNSQMEFVYSNNGEQKGQINNMGYIGTKNAIKAAKI